MLVRVSISKLVIDLAMLYMMSVEGMRDYEV